MCGDQTTSALEQDNVRMRATSRIIKNNMADQNQTHELVSDVRSSCRYVASVPMLVRRTLEDFKNRDCGRNSRKVGALGP